MLFFSRRFFPFFVTQFFGAFNDNLFKNAMLIFFSLTLSAKTLSLYTNLSMALFILPMFIFSAWSGLVAEKIEKRRLILWLKILEVVIILGGIVSFICEIAWLMMLILFLLGLQSAFFGPVKYGILPERLKNRELMAGNGYVEAGTFLAILSGTLMGAELVGRAHNNPDNGLTVLYITMLGATLCGAIAAFCIPKLGEDKKVELPKFQPWQQTKTLLSYTKSQPNLFKAILAISWFWLLGGVLLTQIPQFTSEILGATPQVTTYLLALFSIGIGLGSVSANFFTKGRIEPGLSTLAAFFIAFFFAWIAYLAGGQADPHVNKLDFMGFYHHGAFWSVTIAFLGMAISGGLFVVPLYALLQHQSEDGHKSQIIAANNIMNALFVVVVSLFSIVVLSILGWSMRTLLSIICIIHLVLAVKMFTVVPDFTLRCIAKILSYGNYRIRIEGYENIPEKGAVVMIANHITYTDALMLMSICHRPIRFIIYYKIFNLPFLNFLFRHAKTIPIAGRNEDIKLFKQAFETTHTYLKNEEVVLIFPEGSITPDGEVKTFKRGIENILKRDPVPVIPIYIDNLWGSFFSHHGGLFKGPPRKFRALITVTFGKPVSPTLNAEQLRDEVLKLKPRD